MLPVYVPPLPLSPAFAAADAAGASPAPAASADARTIEAAVQFEGLFIARMFQAMRQAAEAFGDPAADEQSALLDHACSLVADDIARQRAFGIADSLLAQLAAPSGGSGS